MNNLAKGVTFADNEMGKMQEQYIVPCGSEMNSCRHEESSRETPFLYLSHPGPKPLHSFRDKDQCGCSLQGWVWLDQSSPLMKCNRTRA